MPDTDTRDRVIRVETTLQHLVDMVEKNSSRLTEIHERQLRQEGAVGFAKHAIEAAKLITTGGTGAGILAAFQHWIAVAPKL